MMPLDVRPDGDHDAAAGCGACAEGLDLGFAFTMAFQPIVDITARRIFAHEALVRGTEGQGAGQILSQVTASSMYRFDQLARVKAIELAARLGIDCYVSINFMPNAVYRPETCIRRTLTAARRYGFPLERIMFEMTESEEVMNRSHMAAIVAEYRRQGFRTAIDDFGAGFSGLNLLSAFQPDFVKIDMELVRHVDRDPVRRAIVRHSVGLCTELGIMPIAEGVEDKAELATLTDLGITLFQGYLFAWPQFEALATVETINWP